MKQSELEIVLETCMALRMAPHHELSVKQDEQFEF